MVLIDALTPNESKILLGIDDTTGVLKDDSPRNLIKIELIVIGSVVAYATATSYLSRARQYHHHATVARGLPQ